MPLTIAIQPEKSSGLRHQTASEIGVSPDLAALVTPNLAALLVVREGLGRPLSGRELLDPNLVGPVGRFDVLGLS